MLFLVMTRRNNPSFHWNGHSKLRRELSLINQPIPLLYTVDDVATVTGVAIFYTENGQGLAPECAERPVDQNVHVLVG